MLSLISSSVLSGSKVLVISPMAIPIDGSKHPHTMELEVPMIINALSALVMNLKKCVNGIIFIAGIPGGVAVLVFVSYPTLLGGDSFPINNTFL